MSSFSTQRRGVNPYDYFASDSDDSSENLSYSGDEYDDDDTISDIVSIGSDHSNNQSQSYSPPLLSVLRTSQNYTSKPLEKEKRVTFHKIIGRRVLAKALI